MQRPVLELAFSSPPIGNGITFNEKTFALFISVWQQPMLVWCSSTNNICSVHRSCSNRRAPRVFVAASTVSLSTPRVTLYTKFNGSFVSHPCILPPRLHLLPAHLRWVGAKVDPAPCRSPAGIFIYICLMSSVKCSASAVRWISHIHRYAPIIVSRHRRHSKTQAKLRGLRLELMRVRIGRGWIFLVSRLADTFL